MKNYGLTFITNQDLFNHVKDTVKQYRFEINLKSFKHLCQVLPIVIKDVTRSLKISSKNNTVIGEICLMICNESTC